MHPSRERVFMKLKTVVFKYEMYNFLSLLFLSLYSRKYLSTFTSTRSVSLKLKICFYKKKLVKIAAHTVGLLPMTKRP